MTIRERFNNAKTVNIAIPITSLSLNPINSSLPSVAF